MDIGEKRAILQSIGADIVLVEREIGKAKNGRVLTAKFIEVEPYPWLDFLEKSSKKLAPILCKGLNSHLQGELGQKSQLYCAWLDRQDINNAPLSQATGHWTNLGSHPAAHFLLHKKWLDRQDSNLRMLGPKPSALPLGDGPICNTFYHKKTPRRKSGAVLSRDNHNIRTTW